MPVTRITLTAPDARIFPRCHGMGWLYVEDAKVKHLNARLVKCERAARHIAQLWLEDAEEVEVGPVMSRA